ncbi:hypothetical protein IQ278_28470 [Tolypothrix sp. LEGE 11397]|nr:hypothetical protein FDUTEX481_00842 [Tolypothrix sp. PCC 7601]MBE9085986.1 hypothetical protein [Tolypothrix sp. LEGE 11397]
MKRILTESLKKQKFTIFSETHNNTDRLLEKALSENRTSYFPPETTASSC